MFSKDSIIWWCIKTYPKKRKRYTEIMSDPKYATFNFCT